MTEELKYLTEMLKLLWITIVALVGSIAELALAELGLRRWAIGAEPSLLLACLLSLGVSSSVSALLSESSRRSDMDYYLSLAALLICGGVLLYGAWMLSR